MQIMMHFSITDRLGGNVNNIIRQLLSIMSGSGVDKNLCCYASVNPTPLYRG